MSAAISHYHLWCLFIVVGVAVLALVLFFFISNGRRQREPDLGSISQAWIAEHRSSSHDINR